MSEKPADFFFKRAAASQTQKLLGLDLCGGADGVQMRGEDRWSESMCVRRVAPSGLGGAGGVQMRGADRWSESRCVGRAAPSGLGGAGGV